MAVWWGQRCPRDGWDRDLYMCCVRSRRRKKRTSQLYTLPIPVGIRTFRTNFNSSGQILINLIRAGLHKTFSFGYEKKKKKILTEGKFPSVRRVTQKFSAGYPSVSFFFSKNFCFFFLAAPRIQFFRAAK